MTPDPNPSNPLDGAQRLLRASLKHIVHATEADASLETVRLAAGLAHAQEAADLIKEHIELRGPIDLSPQWVKCGLDDEAFGDAYQDWVDATLRHSNFNEEMFGQIVARSMTLALSAEQEEQFVSYLLSDFDPDDWSDNPSPNSLFYTGKMFGIALTGAFGVDGCSDLSCKRLRESQANYDLPSEVILNAYAYLVHHEQSEIAQKLMTIFTRRFVSEDIVADIMAVRL